MGMETACMTEALFGFITVSIIYASAWYTFFKGLRSARFFLLAWTPSSLTP